MHVEDLLHDSDRRLDGRPALVDADKELTASEIDLMSSRMAVALVANGISGGDHVMVFMDDSWQAIVSILAILKAGAAFAPVEPATTGEALAALIKDNRATGLVTQSRLVRATATAMAAAPRLRLTVIAGCEGAPEIDGILRFEDAIAEGRAMPEGTLGAAKDPAILADLFPAAARDAIHEISLTTVGRGFCRFVAAARRGTTLVLEKSEELLAAAE
jgi:acyl-CoA synthetase (AMP-forming)/AMP-acid ligase II